MVRITPICFCDSLCFFLSCLQVGKTSHFFHVEEYERGKKLSSWIVHLSKIHFPFPNSFYIEWGVGVAILVLQENHLLTILSYVGDINSWKISAFRPKVLSAFASTLRLKSHFWYPGPNIILLQKSRNEIKTFRKIRIERIITQNYWRRIGCKNQRNCLTCGLVCLQRNWLTYRWI